MSSRQITHTHPHPLPLQAQIPVEKGAHPAFHGSGALAVRARAPAHVHNDAAVSRDFIVELERCLDL